MRRKRKEVSFFFLSFFLLWFLQWKQSDGITTVTKSRRNSRISQSPNKSCDHLTRQTWSHNFSKGHHSNTWNILNNNHLCIISHKCLGKSPNLKCLLLVANERSLGVRTRTIGFFSPISKWRISVSHTLTVWFNILSVSTVCFLRQKGSCFIHTYPISWCGPLRHPCSSVHNCVLRRSAVLWLHKYVRPLSCHW